MVRCAQGSSVASVQPAAWLRAGSCLSRCLPASAAPGKGSPRLCSICGVLQQGTGAEQSLSRVQTLQAGSPGAREQCAGCGCQAAPGAQSLEQGRQQGCDVCSLEGLGWQVPGPDESGVPAGNGTTKGRSPSASLQPAGGNPSVPVAWQASVIVIP